MSQAQSPEPCSGRWSGLPPGARFRVAVLAFLSAGVGLLHSQTPAPDPKQRPNSPVLAQPVPRDPRLPTIWVAGDSTAAAGTGETQQGWAVPFADYFDPAKINVVNRARGGRSSRTFITEGLWDSLIAGVKPGDIVLIQFGHNDAGALNDEPPPPLRARGTLPGLGNETKEIDNVLTKKHEVVHTYGWYMSKMIAEAKAKGAMPIVLSLTVRDIWQDGRVERGSAGTASGPLNWQKRLRSLSSTSPTSWPASSKNGPGPGACLLSEGSHPFQCRRRGCPRGRGRVRAKGTTGEPRCSFSPGAPTAAAWTSQPAALKWV